MLTGPHPPSGEELRRASHGWRSATSLRKRSEIRHFYLIYFVIPGDADWLVNGAGRVQRSSSVFGKEAFTFAEVQPVATQMARILQQKFAIQVGDVVHLVVPGSCEMFVPVLGAWLLRAVVSPGDPGLSVDVISCQMGQANAKVVFCCQASLKKVRKAVGLLDAEIPIIVMNDGKVDELDEGVTSLTSLIEEDNGENFELLPPSDPVEIDQLIMICWSSGTTGRPKGIKIGSNRFYKELDGNKLLSKILQTTCFFHCGGFFGPLLSLLQGHTRYFIAPEDLNNNIGLMLSVAEESAAEAIFCGSHDLIHLAAFHLAEGQPPVYAAKYMIPFGTNVYDGIFEDLQDKFPSLVGVVNLYGQTEGGVISLGMDQKCLGGIHCPAVRIVDPDTHEVLGPDEVGEITYKTDIPMLGYLDLPEENEKFFGSEGFVHSGDLGHYDEHGTLYYDGRLKELIKYKNFHLYPNELEEILMGHDAVKDAAVFGKPEASVQELVTALVVRKRDTEVETGELEDLVNEQVDDHKQLRGGVHFVHKIPRNPQGKILRCKLLAFMDCEVEVPVNQY